jgi:hypothetical protein
MTSLTRTFPPATTVPVRSLMTILAGRSTSTNIDSRRARNPATPPASAGGLTLISPACATSLTFRKTVVDEFGNANGVREVGPLHHEADGSGRVDGRHGSLRDEAAAGHAPGVRVIDADAGAAGIGERGAGGNRSLRHHHDHVAERIEQRRLKKHASRERSGVSER